MMDRARSGEWFTGGAESPLSRRRNAGISPSPPSAMHTRFVFPSVVAALVATGFFSIAAQQSDTTARGDTTAAGDTARAPQRLQPVVVEATRARQNLTRVPQAVSEVGIDEIQRGRREAGLDEALEGIPGVIAE